MNNRDQIRSTSKEDEAIELAVLQQVLALHPTAVTLAELVREIVGVGTEFADHDAVKRAVRDLTGAGLLHHSKPFVLPTRAALRFDELLSQ